MQRGLLLGALTVGTTFAGIASYYNQILNFLTTSSNSSGLASNPFYNGPFPVTVREPNPTAVALVGIGALMLLGLRGRKE